MCKTERIEILLSKSKMKKTLVGSIPFFVVGVWFIIWPPKVENSFFGNPIVILVTGIVSLILFALVAITIITKLKESKPGLIIDNTGITDNASGISAGHIPWKDIMEIKVLPMMKQKFLMIIVHNPNQYIDRQTNVLKRKGAAMNYKFYGSPIYVTANTLKCDFEELQKILTTQLAKSRIK